METSMGSITLDYLDADNIKRRVLVPSKDVDPSEGIPISLDVDRLFPDTPLGFRQRLVNELWAQNLIEKADFLSPTAPNRIRAALLAAIKGDTVEIINYARSM